MNLNPDRAAAHIALGRALTGVGQTGDAAEQFSYAADLAHRLEASGRLAPAALVYEQLASEPSVPAAIRDVARARRGSITR